MTYCIGLMMIMKIENYYKRGVVDVKNSRKILVMISDGMRCYVVALSAKDKLSNIFKQARKLSLYDYDHVFIDGIEMKKSNFNKTLKELGIKENVSIVLR